MKKIYLFTVLMLALALSGGMISCDSGSTAASKASAATKATGDHDDHGDEGGHDDHGDEGGHDDHGDEGGEEGGHGEVITMSGPQLKAQGVEFAAVGSGPIVTHLTLPAEVGFNQDTLLHITPRAPGISGKVLAYLGDNVEAGQTLAVLQSIELGEAKIALLQQLQIETIDLAALDRQQTISSATERLLEIMRTEPTLEKLQAAAEGLRIGENKGRLISAYARLKSADARYEMEKGLRAKGISTEAALLVAQEMYNSSLAEYMGIFEEIDFMFRVRLQEAEQAARTASSSVLNAKRRLYLLGLSDEQIEAATVESASDIARYEIKSPRGGRIVAKHITPGEKISGNESVYTVASLDTVWLNIAVYERYVDQIRKGQSVVVHAKGHKSTTGRVIYVSADLNEGTRTVTARVVLENKDLSWKPGEFVTVRIETGTTNVARRIGAGAIQKWEGRSVVFVRDDDGIEPRPVRIGRRNEEYVELLGDDIPLGAIVVVQNSFLMKSELGKSSAGHEH